MSLETNVLGVLEATSRTFFIPITRLPQGLQEAVAAAYLCMRAIDEVEDHPDLAPGRKVELLRAISGALQTASCGAALNACLKPFQTSLPEVTMRLSEWISLAPEPIGPRIWDATAAMAERMAHWVACGWAIQSEADLDRYTFSVAGAVGLLLSDLWGWYDSTQTDRELAIGFGRGLQAVNLLRNRREDLARGVDLFPPGWGSEEMLRYARRNLELAERYLSALPPGPALEFCRSPFVLAWATLDVLARGREKLTRVEVQALTGEAAAGG